MPPCATRDATPRWEDMIEHIRFKHSRVKHDCSQRGCSQQNRMKHNRTKHSRMKLIRRTFSYVLVALSCCTVALAQRSSAINIPFETYTLPNGLTVVLSTDHTAPTVAVNIWYHVGSKNEVPGRTGFAHLFEHVMFTGSAHVPYGLHDQLTEGVGGSNDGSTTNDRTNYFEIVPANYLESALWLEADRMGFLLDTLDIAKL